ncbi:hypothetical protein FEM48_Zijuj10G0030600 [Ziziphus jujuba var. spinosa]|uniref:Stress-associated endoplasmic reticulum protein 2-like n=1 Tax=Ziziphus jujuba var. spinosa TaxID=714518 RepID=A0A978UKX5_ZIZJJ|nr:hypothetical protein FEM48_Zijuj10G0030600 [Ziziphus jujuba var. spinosa]
MQIQGPTISRHVVQSRVVVPNEKLTMKPVTLKRDNRTTSRRLADRKVGKFEKNITKRGAVPETSVKKGKDYPVGPVLLGFFIFVVIGSSLFQIIRTATSGGVA